MKRNKEKEEKPTTVEKKICSGCGTPKRLGEFYYSSTYLNRYTGTVPMCKGCMLDYVKPEYKNLYDIQKIKEVLRMVDKPFIQRLWDAAKEESDKRGDGRDYYGTYMKNIAMKDFKDLTWNDSDFLKPTENNDKVAVSSTNTEDDDLETIDEVELARLKKFWGEGTVSDYLFLEDFYQEYMANFPKETPAQKNIYKNLAKIHLNAEKALANNAVKDYKDLMDLSSKMHNDANIKPIQTKGAGEDKGLNNYGLWIRDIENYEPCEYFKDKPVYEDYDGFQGYFEKWILRPMKNIFGKNRDFDVGED